MSNNPKQPKRKSFILEAFSEKGVASSKRILGAICLFVCLWALCYLVLNEGGTDTVEHLLQTMIIVAASLLGLGSITKAASDIFTAKEEMKDSTKQKEEVEDAAE